MAKPWKMTNGHHLVFAGTMFNLWWPMSPAGIQGRYGQWNPRPRGPLRRRPPAKRRAADPDGRDRGRARMRIGAVLRPAVLLTFVDGTGLLQHVDRPPPAGSGSTSFTFRTDVPLVHMPAK